MEKQAGYTRRMTHRLSAWRSRLDARRRQAAEGGEEVAAELRERLEASKVAGDAAFAKLTELRRARAHYFRVRHEMEVVWKAIDDGAPEALDPSAGPDRASNA